MQPSTNLSVRISTKPWTFFLKPENISLKKVKKSNSPCPIIYSRLKSFSYKLVKNILILDEAAVEQNANTSAIYHTGIDEITEFVLLWKHDHDNFTWCSCRIVILRRYQCYYGDYVYQYCREIWRWNFPRRFPFLNLPMLLRLNSTLLMERHLFYKQLFCFRVRN